MLISKEKLESYLDSIPPLDSAVKDCLKALNESDLTKAAMAADKDPALMFHIKSITEKPIYGFTKPLSDPKQIFGVLGLTYAKSVVENFLFSKIMPQQFSIFNIDRVQFHEFQDEFLARWMFILRKLGFHESKHLSSLAPLVTGTVIFCDRVFAEQKDFIESMRLYSDVNYNDILYKLTGNNLFDLSVYIGEKWNLERKALVVVEKISKLEEDELAKYIYLLFFFLVSKECYINTGLNDFIEFQPEYIKSVVGEFQQMMEEYDAKNS